MLLIGKQISGNHSLKRATLNRQKKPLKKTVEREALLNIGELEAEIVQHERNLRDGEGSAAD